MSRPAPAPPPDLSSRLLAAVAERDPALAARLGQQWVHRRGLAALDHYLLTALAPTQGLEAVQWLQAQLGLDSAPVSSGFDANDQAAVAEPEPQPQQPRPLSLVPPLGPSSTPAPAPPSLAALRSWLPDAEHDGRDLPRAC